MKLKWLPKWIRSRRGDIRITYKSYKPWAVTKDGRPRYLFGEAYPEDQDEGKPGRVWVNKDKQTRSQARTICHEYVHAREPYWHDQFYKDKDCPEKMVRALENVIWDLVVAFIEADRGNDT